MNKPFLSPQSPTTRVLHIEHLGVQREHLLLIRDRHSRWMGSTNDPEVRRIHYALMELFDKIDDQYDMLIERLQETNQSGT